MLSIKLNSYGFDESLGQSSTISSSSLFFVVSVEMIKLFHSTHYYDTRDYIRDADEIVVSVKLLGGFRDFALVFRSSFSNDDRVSVKGVVGFHKPSVSAKVRVLVSAQSDFMPVPFWATRTDIQKSTLLLRYFCVCNISCMPTKLLAIFNKQK